jgi:hypothetical protein
VSEELIDKARRLLRPVVDPDKRDPTIEEALAKIERETGVRYAVVREKERS